MQLKYFTLAALARFTLAQDQNATQGLDAVLSGNAQLSNLTAFLSGSPELVSVLSNATNITILAPSDEAFANFANSSTGIALASDPDLIAALLQYHVLNGTFASSQISNTSTLIPTFLTNETYTNVTDGQVVEVLTIGNETVYYSGLLQNATVTEPDLKFSGGIIHVIDSVLVLPASVYETAGATNLTALRGAVNLTDLTEIVNEESDLTIFAPTNEAFLSIGSALENLSESDIASILAYHVVNGTVAYSDSLQNGTNLTSLEGGDLEITVDENGIYFVNAARIVTPNVLVANGVLHIIDNVLNPNNTEGPQADATSGAPGFTATPVNEIPFTSGQPTPSTTVNPTSEGPGPASSIAASTSTAGVMPVMTGSVGYGALLGAGAAVFFGA